MSNSTTNNLPLAPTTAVSQKFESHFPALTIKLFHGDVRQWKPFRECFNEAVHTNTTNKFQHLRNYLVGEARLPTKDTCYEIAIQLLKQRVGDKSRIIQQHFRALREQPPVMSSSNTRELRKL
ncbi:hypothetical protein HPB51_027561 [Rhipicephalus microplus]|uniref:Tick transposon n=1 Tax=Rhipicephalus microplus TaxID=6941 RepID=A0A9J6CZK9_RHIMP|nr:hypothetical protein HPB51_027561 [Rhipicephalus microplus]